ncbi:TVP38/TMEM64 family protein [Sphingopyxis witflariensis]|nr:VTT domain-containing protein [Sphingopyxis witflariensis]
MKSLIKMMAGLAAIFASTFVIARMLGILTVDNVRSWLDAASDLSGPAVAAVVVALLFLDLFVAVPTLTVMILGGYFLGFLPGLAAALAGSCLAAVVGYGLGARFGVRIIKRIVKDPAERARIEEAFGRHGTAMILFARAAPILPEVTSCMAGATGMPFAKFAFFYLLATLPYAAIAVWAGSISSLDDPLPAIYAVVGLYALFWAGGYAYRRRNALRAPGAG